jgi:hypothetical protein
MRMRRGVICAMPTRVLRREGSGLKIRDSDRCESRQAAPLDSIAPRKGGSGQAPMGAGPRPSVLLEPRH